MAHPGRWQAGLLAVLLAGCPCGPTAPHYSESGVGAGGASAGGTGSSGGGCTEMCGNPGCGTCPPEGDVEVADYAIDATEVTNAAYAVWLALRPSTAAQPARCASNSSFVPQSGWPPDAGDEELPVVGVDWCDALAYCTWAGKHLCGRRGGGSADFGDFANPARSEWFNACSSGGTRTYPYGDAFDGGACNALGFGAEQRQPAGAELGCRGDLPVFDLSGNVWEWEDACDGQTGAHDRCHLRGGSFHDGSAVVRCDIDDALERGGTSFDVGFRCCRSL